MLKKYPHIRQRDETDCGPAVLAMIALFYRLPISVARIREAAGTDLGGTNLFGLSVAAGKVGFRATSVRAQWENLLTDVQYPAVAHVLNKRGQGHFVVLYKVTKKWVLVGDPAGGVERWNKEEFLKRWRFHKGLEGNGNPHGILMLLSPTPALRETEASPSKWHRLWVLLRPRLPILFEAFLAAILATLLALGTSFFIQVLVDNVLVYEKTNILNTLALGMVLVILFRTAFGILRQYLLVHLAQKIDVELVLYYYGHLLKMPIRFFRTRQVGEILSRMNDAQRIRAFIGGTTLGLLLDATMFVFASVVMFYYHSRLTLLVFAFLPLFFCAFYLLNILIRRIQRSLMEETADLEAHLVESLSGITTLKSFAAESSARQKTEESFLKLIKTQFRSTMLSTSAASAGAFLSAFGALAVLWFGGHQVIAGELSLGQLMFFNSLLAFLFGPMERLAEANVAIQDALIALDRLGEILDLDPEQKDDFRGFVSEKVRGDFSIEKVTFAYGYRKPVLKNITLPIEAGTTVAIVGESGSGKTTLANLLARFDDPDDGRILLDGIDLRDWDIHSLRRVMGIVPQETFIFRGRVRDNIALGHPEPDMIMEAAERANAHEFIARLPERYESLIGERGSDLSGGERQRLAIARALLHDPKILILDEATSNLDSETEFAIQETLNEVKVGRTTVLIAHRLSTVMHADRIVVLHDGELIEKGTHDDLMSRRGKYFSLWQRQMPVKNELAPDRSREQQHRLEGLSRENGPEKGTG